MLSVKPILDKILMHLFGLQFVNCIRLTKIVMPFEDVTFVGSCEITGLFQRLCRGLSHQDIYSNFAWCCHPINFKIGTGPATPKRWNTATIVAYATVPPRIYYNDTDNFILMYPSLMTPHKLMSTLKQRFNTSNIGINDLCIIRQNVVGTLQQWVKLYPEDFNERLRRDLYSFVSPILSHNRIIRSIVPNGYLTYDFTIKPRQPKLDTEPAPYIKYGFRLIKSCILDYNNVEIARQLCLISQALYLPIKRFELVDRCSRKNSENNLGKLLSFNNQLCHWVIEEITKKQGRERAKVITAITEIGTHCLDLKNISSARAICRGLSDRGINHIGLFYRSMSDSTWKALERLKGLEKREDRYHYSGLCIPSVEEHLTLLADVIKYTAPWSMGRKGVLFHVATMEAYSQRIANLLQAQFTRYNFKEFPKLQDLILATFTK